MGGDLASLRDSIAEIDRALLELLWRRMDVAAEVGRLKAQSGAAVVVRDVEDRVLTRARQYAENCGVSTEVMEQIFQAIIAGSVERQHRVGVELRRRHGQRVLILGGGGGMGRWLSAFLSLVGHGVDAVDPAWAALAPSPGRWVFLGDVARLDDYDFVVVAVPLGATAQVLDEVVARRPRGVVVEIASIKEHLRGALQRAHEAGVRCASLHPMFGPGKSPYEPLTFVLACQVEPETERAHVAPLLVHPFTRVVAMPFDRHDRLMGWLLGLAHLSGMLFGAALTRSGLDPAELARCASTTFSRQAATALSVLSEDPGLYLDIQRLNPHRDEVYRATRDALAELERLVATGDADGFRSTLTAARAVFPPTEL